MRRTLGLWRFVVAACMLSVPGAGSAWSCGGAEEPCVIEGGAYNVALPDEPEGAPIVLWLHGYGRSGKVVVSNSGLMEAFTRRGYAVVAPDGQPDVLGGPRLDWGVNDGQSPKRDDVAFLNEVIEDATALFDLDDGHVLAAGFSRGGSMVWDLACLAPDSAKAYAAVAGAFWEPMFERCASPVHILHTHGFADRLVPFEGRKSVWNGIDFEQGDVMKAVQVWRRVNGCPEPADIHETEGAGWTKAWSSCADGSIALNLSPVGHQVPEGWADLILDWFEALP